MSGLRLLRAQHDVGQVGGAEVVRADADDLHARLLEPLLLHLDDGLAVDRVLVLEPDGDVLRLLAEGLADLEDGAHAHLGEVRAVRAGAHEVRELALGELGGDRVGVPVELLVLQRRVARGVRHRGDVRADQQVDLLARHELVDRGDALLRVGRVAAHQLDLLAEHAAFAVSLGDRELVAAGKLVAVERERAAVGIDGADPQAILRNRCAGRHPEQHHAREGEPCTTLDVH